MNKKQESLKIRKDMLISEIIDILPESQELMMLAGLHCVGCFVSNMETLEQGMLGHGYEPEEIDEFVEELNSLYNEIIQNKEE